MRAIIKLKFGISLLLCCFTISLLAQNESNEEMASNLYDVYKNKGVNEVLKVYEQNNTNKDYEGIAEPLNILAYRLMQEDKDLEAAEVLLKAQIEEYPDEANPYDSYSDVLLEMNQMEEAVKYIEKSLAIAEKRDHEQNELIIEAGRAKMAVMDNKDKQLNFLVGNWDNETRVYQNGKEVNSTKGSNNISFDANGSIMIIDHAENGNKPCCKKVMVYNPTDDDFDVALIGRNQPLGISNSKIQLTQVSPDHYEMIEKYMNDQDEEVKLKHSIKKEADKVEWITYNSNGSNWEKVRSMNLNKKD